MNEPHAVVQGQPGINPPVVLDEELDIVENVTPLDVLRQLVVRIENAHSRVGVAIARVQRVTGVLLKINTALPRPRQGLLCLVAMGQVTDSVSFPPLVVPRGKECTQGWRAVYHKTNRGSEKRFKKRFKSDSERSSPTTQTHSTGGSAAMGPRGYFISAFGRNPWLMVSPFPARKPVM